MTTLEILAGAVESAPTHTLAEPLRWIVELGNENAAFRWMAVIRAYFTHLPHCPCLHPSIQVEDRLSLCTCFYGAALRMLGE